MRSLVFLYQDGHIQSHDPITLPPIAPAQLPAILKSKGQLDNRRNAWTLGILVAKASLRLDLLRDREGVEDHVGALMNSENMDPMTIGVRVVANFIVRVSFDSKTLLDGPFI